MTEASEAQGSGGPVGDDVAAATETPRRPTSYSGGRPSGRLRRWAGRAYITFRHPRLRTKLLIGVLAGAVLASGTQFVISYRATMGNLSRLETERMDENLQVALNVVSGQKLSLEQIARDYGSPLVARHVVDRDAAWLDENVLGRLNDTRSVPLAMVLDADGKPIVGTEWKDLSVLSESVVRSASNGVAGSQFARFGDDIWMIAAAPIAIDESNNKYVGTLLVGRPVDDAFADLIKRSTQTEIAFTLDGEVVATTRPELTPVIVNALGGSFTHEGSEVVIANGYSAVTELLGVPGTKGNLVVALSRDPITSAQRELLRDSFIAALLALGIGVVIALAISRQIGRPIAELTGVAKQIATAATVETQAQLPQSAAGRKKWRRGKAAPAAVADPPAATPAATEGDRLDRGLHEARVPVSAARRDEVSDLGRAFNEMVEQVELSHETLRRMAVRDGLTGLLNHREFFERLRAEIAMADRDQAPLSMVMIDLDLFKKVNDTHGHLAGDALLTELSRMIEANVREYDVVARYAGDEFAVILPRTDKEQAAAIGERVRKGTADLPRAAGLPEGETITISVGIVTRKPKQRRVDRDEQQLKRDAELEARRTVEQADTALYRAKNGGRDRVEIQEPAG